jgi:hypothetical protein
MPASRIVVRYRAQKMPDYSGLVHYRTCFGIVSFFSFQYRTDWMPDSSAFIYVLRIYTYTYKHMYYTYTYIYTVHILYSTYMYTYTFPSTYILLYIYVHIDIYADMQHGSRQWTCMDAGCRMPEC